ncbi:2-C-methyl-D-erythritol 2,4-cyclodiphosphate synthase [Fodinibius saliphilus]|uniref:2-C-methyl-D-erythritol 2,4-cyclodiphosphate synthase n=1 Tax=Fodinibius saliphilus TaxID=1920650 RepID=UPI001109B8EA|nr:2-C-methyl-D-erythritol 2,4-cyclodiphosphate synthase [Fodinibius saliphilus]
MRIGYGYDVHRLEAGYSLILGGVKIPYEKGLVGHSDADVLLHAIADALLGACALGDIGQHFPDTEEKYKGVDSRILLKRVSGLVKKEGYIISNIDATVVAEQPKLAPHISEMRSCIAKDLKIDLDQISVKATTSEGVGFEGREQGISSRAVVLIEEV